MSAFFSVEIYYQPIDEMTMTKKWPLLTIWIEDATSSILYEWRRGQQTSEDTEGWFVLFKLKLNCYQDVNESIALQNFFLKLSGNILFTNVLNKPR